MRELHWLPVSSRIRYKLCTLMYDVVHGTAPGYLVDLCRPCGDMRLRSGPRRDYFVPSSRLSMTQKSFRFSGPRAPGTLCRAPFAMPYLEQRLRTDSKRISSNLLIHELFTILLVFCKRR